MRVGIGYDIHRLEAGRRLVLGGVDLEHPLGLAGHSDADVVLHALMDAMLGAAGLGDIGAYFPPSDDTFRDVSSLLLLQRVNEYVRDEGLRLTNADIVLVAERPKISGMISNMKQNIAHALGLETSCIGIKATTNEGVGPEGREEAMSAQAVVLLEPMT